MIERLEYLYVGIDPHKRQHTAVALDFSKSKRLDHYTFENKPSAFSQLVLRMEQLAEKKGFTRIVYGLEDTSNYGRSLAVYLKEQNYVVKEINSKMSEAKRKSYPNVKKSDMWDAQCIATVLIDDFDRLPIANPVDHYWAIKQLISRRASSAKGLEFTIKKLHAQLGHHYPSYKKFFSELDGKTALAFFHRFPSPEHLEKVTFEDLRFFLKKLSNNACSTKKAELILSLVKTDGHMNYGYQEKRDFIAQSLIKEIRFHKREIRQSEEEIKPLMEQLGYKLETMTGIDLVSAACFVAEIGDVNRFGSADQLARFCGVAPIDVGSGGEVKQKKTRQGNRVLHELFFQLACRQLVVSKRYETPRNPILLEYYKKKLSEKKTKNQAIVCVMRKLVNIVYKMLKNKTEYVLPPFKPMEEAV